MQHGIIENMDDAIVGGQEYRFTSANQVTAVGKGCGIFTRLH